MSNVYPLRRQPLYKNYHIQENTTQNCNFCQSKFAKSLNPIYQNNEKILNPLLPATVSLNKFNVNF